MEYNDLRVSFTSEQKLESFLYLQNYMLNQKNKFFIGRLSGNESNLCGKVLSNQKVKLDNKIKSLENVKDIWTFKKDMTTNSLVWKLVEVGTD